MSTAWRKEAVAKIAKERTRTHIINDSLDRSQTGEREIINCERQNQPHNDAIMKGLLAGNLLNANWKDYRFTQ
jgi:hypothetical protein